MNETGLSDAFQEINGVEPYQKEATHECESNCTCYVMATEGILRNITGVEMKE